MATMTSPLVMHVPSIRSELMSLEADRRAVLAAASALLASLISRAPLADGSKESGAMSQAEPFHIAVPASTLSRVKDRLQTVHWPLTSKGAGWRYGVEATWFKE